MYTHQTRPACKYEGVAYSVAAYILYCYTVTVVNVWNSLPGHVVNADTVNCFKSRLGKFWANQELMYNFRSEIYGTGSRSEVVYQTLL